MQKIANYVTVFGVALLFSSAVMLTGCSSGPDEAQLKQLEDLKGEVSSLEKEVAEKEKQAAALKEEVAKKDAKIKKCQDDQQVVKQRLAE
jgi:murein lipoprotein